MKNNSFKIASIITIIFTFFNLLSSFAQIHLNDSNGRLINLNKYEDVEGSSYLFDEWLPGSVKIQNNRDFTKADLKYSDIDEKLYFKSSTGDVMEFKDPIAEFIIIYSKNGVNKEMHFIKGLADSNDKSYYQLLADGNAKLVKKRIKEIQEKKEYGSATVVKSFNVNEKYFVFLNGKLIQVKNDKKSLLSALSDKKLELQKYIDTNHVSLKTDDDMAIFVGFYNSLK